MKFSENWLRELSSVKVTRDELLHQLTMAGLEVDSCEPESNDGTDDFAIDVDLTPNRGDCLSVSGLAREVCAINQLGYQSQRVSSIESSISDKLNVSLDQADACPRYVGRIIRHINPKAETPSWLAERLRLSDIGSISPVVDVLNYVMIEMGQPMHAFDLNKLNGAVHVRMAKAGEQLTLLDEQSVELDDKTLVIADDQAPVAMAGVMGGLESSVTDQTTDVFLESAFFHPIALAGTARRYALHTDSSHRFERGVDFNLPSQAVERATELLLEIVGGEAGPVNEVLSEKDLPATAHIQLPLKKVEQVLGLSLSAADIVAMLERLGMTVAQSGELLDVTVPSYRFDISIPEDLIEEIARMYGYDNIPVSAAKSECQAGSTGSAQAKELYIKDVMKALGYHEAITYSFISDKEISGLTPSCEALPLVNPITSDMTHMRTTLWAGLINAMQHNLHRQQARVRLFEMGLRFHVIDGQLKQVPVLSGIAAGTRQPEQWGASAEKLDFFDVKGDLEQLFQALNIQHDLRFEKGECDALHPGQTAAVVMIPSSLRGAEQATSSLRGAEQATSSLRGAERRGNPVQNLESLRDTDSKSGLPRFARNDEAAVSPNDKTMAHNGEPELIGHIGALHPEVAKKLKIKTNAFLFEIALEPLMEKVALSYQEISKFPAVRRDFAILVNDDVTSQMLQDTIASHLGDLLTDMLVFDVFKGKNVENDKKSVAIGLTFQDPSRTLKDIEINDLCEKAVKALHDKFGATLRD